MKFIHISDVHITKDCEKLFGINPCERLELAINNINEKHSDADFIVITGDLTHYGNLDAYKKLKYLMSLSKIDIILLIGNHDNREVFKQVFENKADSFCQSVKLINSNVFIFLDSVIENTHSGDMCDLRYTWLENQLNKYKDNNVYLFLHHPPLEVGIEFMDNISYKSKNRLRKLLSNYCNIRYIFFGHLHRIVSGIWANIPFFGIKSTTHQTSLKSDRNELYLSVIEKPAYGIINIDRGDVVINVNEYLDDGYFISYTE